MIEDKIQEFKTELKLKKDLDVVRKFITSGDSFVLDSDKYLDLKGSIADHFDIHPMKF